MRAPDSLRDEIRARFRRLPQWIVGLVIVVLLAAVLTIVSLVALSESLHRGDLLAATAAASENAVRLQLDEETGVRGFAASRRTAFLQPYYAAAKRIDRVFDRLSSDLVRIDNEPGVDAAVAMQRIHDEWDYTVAQPIIGRRYGIETQVLGKVLMDRFRARSDQLIHLVAVEQARSERTTRLMFTRSAALTSAIVLSIIALVAAGSRRQYELVRALDKEHEVVETLQRVFTHRWESLPKTIVGAAYLSASAEIAVGGDLFDVRRLDERRGYFLVADVSGKGVPAAVDTALIKYTVNALAKKLADPADILTDLNDAFIESRTDPDSFVVLFLGIFNCETFSMHYASAGHGQAFLRRDDQVEALPVTGPIIGLFETSVFESRKLLLKTNDFLVLATDGLTEGREPSGRLLGEERAMEWVRAVDSTDPQAAVEEIVDRLRTWGGGTTSDDLAILAIRIIGDITASNEELLAELVTQDHSVDIDGT